MRGAGICHDSAASGSCVGLIIHIVYNIQKTGADVKYIRDYSA